MMRLIRLDQDKMEVFMPLDILMLSLYPSLSVCCMQPEARCTNEREYFAAGVCRLPMKDQRQKCRFDMGAAFDAVDGWQVCRKNFPSFPVPSPFGNQLQLQVF